MVPTKKSDKVKDCFWKVPFLTVVFDELKGVGVPFGQLLTRFRVNDQSHVTKLRSFPAKCFINHQLFWCIGNVVISTDNMRNPHFVVIDDNGKVVSWIAIFLFDIALNNVMPLIDTSFIDHQTNSRNNPRCFAFCYIGCFFIFAHSEVFIDIARCFSSCFLAFTFCCQFFFGYIRFIGFPFSQKLINVFLVKWQPFRLAIVFVRFRAFIPIHPQPTKVFKLWTFPVFDVALAVRIFNPNNKGTAIMTCIKVVKQCSTRISDV